MSSHDLYRRNPFIDHSLHDLAHECGRIAGILQERKQRTPDERARLVEETRLLLIAVQASLSFGPTVPGSPEQELSHNLPGVTLESAYLAIVPRRIADVRYEVLKRAAAFALPERWRYDEFMSRCRAIECDESLAAALRDLDTIGGTMRPRGR